MPNDSRNRRNQPPTGGGKKAEVIPGCASKAQQTVEVAQAQPGDPELNIGTSADEAARDDGEERNPHRPKAGR
jgi:hypothetical protein